MANDKFSGHADDVDGSAREAYAIVPADAVLLSPVPKALYIGTGGALVVRAIDTIGPVTFLSVASGSILPVRAAQVLATGTTASNIVALA